MQREGKRKWDIKIDLYTDLTIIRPRTINFRAIIFKTVISMAVAFQDTVSAVYHRLEVGLYSLKPLNTSYW